MSDTRLVPISGEDVDYLNDLIERIDHRRFHSHGETRATLNNDRNLLRSIVIAYGEGEQA